MENNKIVYLGLGSNLGEKQAHLNEAIQCIETNVGQVLSKSSVYVSKAKDFDSVHEFLNMVIEVSTALTSASLIKAVKHIEIGMGRILKNKTQRNTYSDRIIDIDILSYGADVLETKSLTIPHPRMHERKFVLLPLNEINANWKHPVFNLTAFELLLNCEDKNKCELLGNE